MPKKDHSTFDQFFKSDQNIVKDMLQKKDHNLKETFAKKHKKSLPKIPQGEPMEETKVQAHWQGVRSFFWNANNTKGLPKSYMPLLISPLLTDHLIVKEYPIWVVQNSRSHAPLINLVDKAIEDSDAEDISKFSDRLVQIANDLLKGNNQPAKNIIDPAIDDLLSQISMAEEDKQNLRVSFEKMKTHLPGDGILIPFTKESSFNLLNVAIHNATRVESSEMRSKINKYSSKLTDLLSIEEEKDPALRDTSKGKDASSFADSMVKFDQIESMMPEPGGVAMAADRIKRIRDIVRVMAKADEIFEHKAYMHIDPDLESYAGYNFRDLLTGVKVLEDVPENSITSILEIFKEKISEYTKLVIALRTAELELSNKYQADVHDEYFKHFHWQNFSQEELNAFPLFVVTTTDEKLLTGDYTRYSRVLSRNIPIKIICVRKENMDNNTREAKVLSDSLHAPPELGAMMLTQRNIFVAQSTAVSPSHLYQNYFEGLQAFSPAFIYIMDLHNSRKGVKGHILTSAAVESRDFPTFTYKGMLGTPWGSRFKVNSNPDPDQLWTAQSLKIIDSKGTEKDIEFDFTYADYASTNPNYHQFYLPVNPAVWRADLVPLTEYVKLEEEKTIGKVPYIWMIDSDYNLHKVAVAWPMVMATQERFDFWKFLQENSGINNFHVAHAVEDLRKELEEEHQNEIAALADKHQKDIEKARDEEAESVMDNLTAALLDLNLSESSFSMSSLASKKASTRIEATEAKQDESQESKKVTEDFVISNDPYIDTPLCTSCNECINMNNQLFKYDADKMAYIADPKAGTFKELVEAAEKCPVGIIHPGAPLNPDEPNLDQLIVRAEKFN